MERKDRYVMLSPSVKASRPLELPPIASAPTALKARAPAMRSPVRDTLIDERMIIFPHCVDARAGTEDAREH
jgi:hypothetical protein